jgi:hypothetical protein
MQKLNCITCKTQIGTITSMVVTIDMRNVQKSEIDTSNGNLNLKCGICNKWNIFIDGAQGIDEKRKSREVLEYNANLKNHLDNLKPININESTFVLFEQLNKLKTKNR